jgi:hypothetical protein
LAWSEDDFARGLADADDFARGLADADDFARGLADAELARGQLVELAAAACCHKPQHLLKEPKLQSRSMCGQ